MSTKVYPIILHPESEGGFYVNVPDLQIGTQGEDLSDALLMARDAIGQHFICEQNAGRELPEPSLDLPSCTNGDIATFVDIDLAAYRRAHDQRTIHKNLTLPAWISYQAEEAGINFSQVLLEALKEKLNIQ